MKPGSGRSIVSISEWKELMLVPAIWDSWGLDGSESPELFADIVYGVKFDFVTGSPGYVGELYLLHGDALGEPMTVIRRNGRLVAL